MSVLGWILLSSLVGGALSVAAAALVAYSAKAHWVPLLISYAVGALLGAAFLEVLPHALESSRDVGASAGVVLAGIM